MSILGLIFLIKVLCRAVKVMFVKRSDLSRKRSPLPYLYILVFTSLIDHSTIAPVISSYARTVGASAEIAGLIAGAYSIAALLSYPVVGFLLDYLPRARVLLAFYTADIIVVSLYLLARDPAQLLVIRLLHGFFDASIFPSSLALFRDVIHERFGFRFSTYWAVAATPILVGNIVTRVLVVWLGFHSVFLFVLFLMLLGLYSSYSLNIFQARTHPRIPSYSVEEKISGPSIPLLLFSYLSAFTLYMMIGSVVGSMSSRLLALYNIPKEVAAGEIAMWSAIATLVSIPIILGVTRYFLEDLQRSFKALILGLFSIIISSLILLLNLETLARYISSVIFGFSLALLLPTTSRIATETPYRFRGRSSAALGASYLLGVGIGAPLSSWLLQISEEFNLNFLPPLLSSLIIIIILMIYTLISKAPA